MEEDFSSLVDLFEQANIYERRIMKSRQYLFEALEENGISLTSRKTLSKR